MKNKLLYVVMAVTILIFPQFIFAQAPKLGTAAGFVLFTSTGAVANTGLSHLTGNVGTVDGAVTVGINVDGVMHNGDEAAKIAAEDLLNAYNDMNSRAPSSFHAALLGKGETLYGGVHNINEAATLSDTLFLDGNENTVFIFQIQGAFASSANATVILKNGVLACNVFWKSEGAVDMVAGTKMKGTIVANNAAIELKKGVQLEGRALSTAGAISVTEVLAYTPVGCGSRVLTGPAAPALGTIACYALFSSDGLVTNSGVTNVVGDIGTDNGKTVGYDPEKVKGVIHNEPDASTASGRTALLNVYKNLATLSPDIELLYPEQFGNGLTLTPHTYRMNGAAFFTDTLFLNAQGNADAVFVIQIKGALTTSKLAIVRLLNGTQASNVFWQVDDAVDISSASEFKGTIVNSGVINLNSGSKLEGRALTMLGNLNTYDATTTMDPTACTLLPVNWLYFRGKPMLENILLEWATAKEKDNSFFTIEKSRDGNKFDIVTTVQAQSKGEYQYSFTDRQPYSTGYYRISQTDINGKINFFKVIRVDLIQREKTLLYVQENYIYVQTSVATPCNATIALYSIESKKVSSQNVMLTKDASTYKIQKPLRKGMYLVNIESNGKRIYSGKVMVL